MLMLRKIMIDRVEERDGEIYRFSGERNRGQRKRRRKRQREKHGKRVPLIVI